MAAKFIVIGDVDGRIEELISKLRDLVGKHHFTFAIIAGNLFKDPANAEPEDERQTQALLDGSIDIPLTVYVAPGRRAMPPSITKRLHERDGELCPGLVCLGRKSRIKTAEGIRIVSVGGAIHSEADGSSPSQWSGTYTAQDVNAAISYNEADVLITSHWPKGIRDGSKIRYDGEEPQEFESIAKLCSALKPKYHLSSSSPASFVREAFTHGTDEPRSWTNFVSVAPLGSLKPQKGMFASNIDSTAARVDLPSDATPSPFEHTRKRKLESQQEAFNGYRFSNGSSNQHEDHRGRRRKAHQKVVMPDNCFFCLSNPACETHMVASIGDDAYLTVAKGPLPMKDTFPALKMPGHMLIIPLVHAPTLGSIAGADVQKTTIAEMQKYRKALQEWVASVSKDDNGRSTLGTVTWELSRAGGVHHHWQFLPVPVDLITGGKVEALFRSEAVTLSSERFEKRTVEFGSSDEGNTFKVMIWSDTIQFDLVLSLDESFSFDFQIGRRVLGKLLKLEGRAHWKDCGQSKTDEEVDVAKFKESFAPFDFSLT